MRYWKFNYFFAIEKIAQNIFSRVKANEMIMEKRDTSKPVNPHGTRPLLYGASEKFNIPAGVFLKKIINI
jgi:hypothetical protein